MGGRFTSLLKESDEHDALQVAIGIVFNELGMTPEQGTSSLVTRVLNITDRVRGMVRQALHLGVRRSFTITHFHYENIDLQTMSQGFTPGYDDAELDRIEEEVIPPMHDLAASMEDEAVPILKKIGS
jgi:hypothetical protein